MSRLQVAMHSPGVVDDNVLEAPLQMAGSVKSQYCCTDAGYAAEVTSQARCSAGAFSGIICFPAVHVKCTVDGKLFIERAISTVTQTW